MDNTKLCIGFQVQLGSSGATAVYEFGRSSFVMQPFLVPKHQSNHVLLHMFDLQDFYP